MELYKLCSANILRNVGRYSGVKSWMNSCRARGRDKVNHFGLARTISYICCPRQQMKGQHFLSSILQTELHITVLSSAQRLDFIKNHNNNYSSTHHRHDRRHTTKIKEPQKEEKESDVPQTEQAQSPGLMQRFKNAYKQYGKTLVAVHVATSIVWLGSFYYAAASGIDIVPLLEKMGASETIMKPFKSTGLGDIAVAYLLYKLATPVRYTVTIVGTQQAAKYLKNTGYIQPIPEGDSFKELMKEGSKKMRHTVKKRSDKVRHNVKTRTNENREKLKESYGEYKQRSSDFMTKSRRKRTKEP